MLLRTSCSFSSIDHLTNVLVSSLHYLYIVNANKHCQNRFGRGQKSGQMIVDLVIIKLLPCNWVRKRDYILDCINLLWKIENDIEQFRYPVNKHLGKVPRDKYAS